MSGSITKWEKVAPIGGSVSQLLSTSTHTRNFNLPCGPSAPTIALDSLAYNFKGYLTTAGTGVTQWAGVRLGSNAIVKKIKFIINSKVIVEIDNYDHYLNQRIHMTADYGTRVAGTTGKMGEYYCAQTISSAAERWFKANISCNGLGDTKQVIDLSKLNSFNIEITIASMNHCLYNTTGDPRFTISDMFVSFLSGRKATAAVDVPMMMIHVVGTEVASATTMTIPFPEDADVCKRMLICINQTETNMTTALKYISDASTVTDVKFNIPSGVWPQGGLDSTYINPDLYTYARDCYKQSNLSYFSSDGIDYAGFYTASTVGYMGFNFAGVSDEIAKESTAIYSTIGESVTTASTLFMKQSAVTVAGQCRVFQESLAMCTLANGPPITTGFA